MMQILSRKSVIGAFALVAALSAPLAFAQSAAATVEATPAATTTQNATSTENTTATIEASTEATQPSVAPATASTSSIAPPPAPPKKSWSDIDADKNGKLTKAEAGTVPALAKVFDRADGNADGALTTDEYKAYTAQLQGGSPGADGSK